MARIRLDKIVLKRNLAETIEESLTLIESGKILVNGSVQTSPKSFVDMGCAIEFIPEKSKFVSRGGLKLEHALKEFRIDPNGKRCLDIGASTGGFTDCLLSYGANHVVALDVGHGQLDLSMRNNPNVTVLERTNAKDINVEMIGGICQLGVMDVSFTSILRLIKPVVNCLVPKELVVLIKPQFECEPKFINSRGIVTEPKAQIDCIRNIAQSLPEGLEVSNIVVSPIKGAKGNIEFLALIRASQNNGSSIDQARIESVVNSANENPEN